MPDLAVEGRLGVDLELMHVDLAVQDLFDRFDQPRVRAQAAKALVIGVRGEGRAGDPGTFPPDLLAIQGINGLGFMLQNGGFLGREHAREKQIALVIELL